MQVYLMPMQIMDLRLEILIGPSIWLLSWVSTPKCLPAFLTQTGFKYFCDVLGSLCRFLLSFHNKRAWRPPVQPWTGTFRTGTTVALPSAQHHSQPALAMPFTMTEAMQTAAEVARLTSPLSIFSP